jgi:hypothetical protein
MWFDPSDENFKFPVAQVLLLAGSCEETKNSRDGFKHCLRIDMKLPPQADVDALYAHDIGLEWGVEKVVLGFMEQTEFAKWISALGWALKAQTVVENHVALKSGKFSSSDPAPAPAPAPASAPAPAPAVAHTDDAEALRRISVAQAMEEMEAEQQALAREQQRALELQREAEAATAQSEDAARRLAIEQKLEQEDRDIAARAQASAQASSQTPVAEEEHVEEQLTLAVTSADRASTIEEAEVALARMELSQPAPAPAAAAPGRGRRASVSVDEWTVQKSKLVAKVMCLRGGEVWKFAREKIMKKKWQNPVLKTLVAPGKGFIVWTGRKPVRYTKVSAGPSEALNFLM